LCTTGWICNRCTGFVAMTTHRRTRNVSECLCSLYACCSCSYLFPKVSAYNRNFVDFGKIIAGKHCSYSRQHYEQCMFAAVHKREATSFSVCVDTHVSTSESPLTLNHVQITKILVAVIIVAALCNRGAIIFLPCSFFLSSFYLVLFFSPNLSGHRLHVCHTSAHGVALVRI